MALVEDTGAGAAADDPEALLNEWLGELTVLTAVCFGILLNKKENIIRYTTKTYIIYTNGNKNKQKNKLI